ncbi:MAG: lactam utilization protein LamB [Deltaproteobacteria bacterium RBG_16_48_10]|nr:MAG: lactam utilization protein LamB [Deltaproteobacteria bacterium RBG_16_48_10]
MRMDLNSDVGESFGAYKLGLDEEVIPHITSANIACGFHAGDPGVMRHTVALAKKFGVEVGAHPGFPDLMGFGRRNMDATLEEIQDYVVYQMGALQVFAHAQGLKLQHVKPHGALYNMAAANPKMWDAIAEAVAKVDKEMILVALASSNRDVLAEIGKRHGVRFAFEAFPDRAYKSDGSLASRREKGAVIQDHGVVAQRALKMAFEGKVIATDGTEIELKADTLCVHGDNPAAVQMVKKIQESFKASGVEVTPMKNFI